MASTAGRTRNRKPAAVAADRFDANAFLIEKGVDQQTAADYLALRKGKRAASTPTAMRAVVRESEKAGMALQDTLTMCCAKGWAGFEAGWLVQQARAGPVNRPEKFDPVAHVNRNRTPAQRYEAAENNVIDITPERVA